MAFCSVQDVVDRLSSTGILVLVDDDNDGILDASEEAYIEDAISYAASTEINPALMTVTASPSSYEGNETLKWWAVDLACERITQRKGASAPDPVVAAADRVRENLRAFRENRLIIPGVVPSNVSREQEFRGLGRPRIARR